MTPDSRLPAGELTLDALERARLKPLKGKTVLVVGDLIFDHYLWGAVERTTPEAPVPIVRHERDSWALGGAANVAHNIAALGGKALLVGVAGDDDAGKRLKAMLRRGGIATRGVVVAPGRPTTVKTRVVSMGQQLLRIDREETSPLPEPVERKLIDAIATLSARARAIVLSDYAKNALGPGVVAAAIRAGRERGIPVLADPKGRDFGKYRGADILTPNLRETAVATGLPVASEEDLTRAGRELMRRCGLGSLIVTRGSEGVALLRPRRKILTIPARAREVFDVTGAGDTFVATLALGLAAGLDLPGASALANHAGGVVVAKLGVATVSPAELLAALGGGGGATGKIRPAGELKILLANQQTTGRKVVFTNGCFDLLHPGHIQFLHQARALGDTLVVGLNTDRSVRAVKGPKRPILAQDERAAILAALEVVDHIVLFDELTPEALLEDLRPDILVKGGDTPEDQIVGREIVQSHGGQVRRLAPASGAATTDLVQAILGKFKPGA